MAPSLTDGQNRVLHVVMLTTGSASMAFSLVVIASHLFLANSRRQFNDPVFWLSVSCFFAPLFTFGFGAWGEVWCVAEGTGNQFFTLASFIWLTCIAHQLYTLLCIDTPTDTTKSHRLYHLFGWGVPALTLLILLAANKVETEPEAMGWCWVEPGAWRLSLFYVPMFALIVVNCFAYVLITSSVYRKYKHALAVHTGRSSRHFARQTLAWGFKVSLYLLVFIITRSGSAVNRVNELFHPDEAVFALRLLHVMGSGLQGFLYALVYMYNERVIARLRNACATRTANSPSLRFQPESSVAWASSVFSEDSRLDLYSEDDFYDDDNDDDDDDDDDDLSNFGMQFDHMEHLGAVPLPADTLHEDPGAPPPQK